MDINNSFPGIFYHKNYSLISNNLSIFKMNIENICRDNKSK